MNGFCQILNSDTTERWYYFLHLHTNHKRRFHYPANLFKYNSRNTRKKYEISSKLTIKTFFIVFLLLARFLSLYHAIVPSVDLDIQIWIFKSLDLRRHWRHSDVFIVNFKHVSHFFSSVSIVEFEQVKLACTNTVWGNNN